MKSAKESVLNTIKEEHHSMSAVFKAMNRYLQAIYRGEMKSDPYLFSAIFDYIEVFPDRLHHPKEEEFLFPLLRQRSECTHATLDVLQQEHAEGQKWLLELRQVLKTCQKNENLADLEAPLKRYADFIFYHMVKEESMVIPMAEQFLLAEDWESIHAAFLTKEYQNFA